MISSNAPSPIQIATALACFEVVVSDEGEQLRARLRRNVDALRGLLEVGGITCFGGYAPFVLFPATSLEAGRQVASTLFDRGVFVGLVEFPAVPIRSPRFRLQVMADHTPEDIVRAGTAIRDLLDRT